MVEPIKPRELTSLPNQVRLLPNEVIEAFNELIVEKWDGSSSVILQIEAISKILRKFKFQGLTRQQIFRRRYLEIEGIFRKVGWKVTYSRPSHSQDPFEPFFKFEK
jgi:hypothetical protein